MRRITLSDVRLATPELTSDEISEFKNLAMNQKEKLTSMVLWRSEKEQGIVDGIEQPHAGGPRIPFRPPQILCEHFATNLGIVVWVVHKQFDRRVDSLRNQISIAVFSIMESQYQWVDSFNYRPKNSSDLPPLICIKRCTWEEVEIDIPQDLRFCN
jgi:hypothetical protein